MLEYKKKFLYVKRDFIGKLIGKNGRNINDIIKKSGVIKIQIEGNNELQPNIPHREGYILFMIVGTVESIYTAKVLVKQHKDLEPNKKEKQMEMAMPRRFNRNLNADSENMNNGQSISKEEKVTDVYVVKTRVGEHFLKYKIYTN